MKNRPASTPAEGDRHRGRGLRTIQFEPSIHWGGFFYNFVRPHATSSVVCRPLVRCVEFPRQVTTMTVLSGKCLCGQVQIFVRGDPLRIGICHCTDCRRESGSAFTFYAVWPAPSLNTSARRPNSMVNTSVLAAGRDCSQPMIKRPKLSSGSCQKPPPLLCRAMSSGSNAASRG